MISFNYKYYNIYITEDSSNEMYKIWSLNRKYEQFYT